MLPFKLKTKTIADFKIDLRLLLPPKKYKFYSKGNKYKCSLLTQIRVGQSLLNKHSFTLGFSESMICEKCSFTRESALHFLTQCEAYSDLRLIMLKKIEPFKPNISILPKKNYLKY